MSSVTHRSRPGRRRGCRVAVANGAALRPAAASCRSSSSPPSLLPSLYIFLKAASRFLPHALRSPQESSSTVSVVAPKTQLASFPAPPSLPALSLSLRARVSHPWPLPPSLHPSPRVAPSSSLGTARASLLGPGTANHTTSLSCLLWEMLGCHGDSRLHLCQCVSERRFQQEIDGAAEVNRLGADERGEEEEEEEEREPRLTDDCWDKNESERLRSNICFQPHERLSAPVSQASSETTCAHVDKPEGREETSVGASPLGPHQARWFPAQHQLICSDNGRLFTTAAGGILHGR